MIGNKIADKITKVSRTSPMNSSGAVKSKIQNIGFDSKLPGKRYISPE